MKILKYIIMVVVAVITQNCPASKAASVTTQQQSIINLFGRNLELKNASIEQYTQELKVILFSSQILQRTIQAILTKQYEKLDGVVGDCKCQVRTSMLLDVAPKLSQQASLLAADFQALQAIEQQAIDAISGLITMSHLARQGLSVQLKQESLASVLAQTITPCSISPDVTFAAQCFATNPVNQIFPNKEQSTGSLAQSVGLSKSAFELMEKTTKRDLCSQTIIYEQSMAERFESPEVQQALTCIETKGQTKTTAFFPAIKPILAKMATSKQAIELRKEIYCGDCAGLQITMTESFASNGKEFQPTPTLPQDQVIMIIAGNQYQGSFQKLKITLGIDARETAIPAKFKRPCACQSPTTTQSLPLPVDEAITNNAAEHTQFITGIDIPFEPLGLANSQLKREYDMRKQPKGFGIEDMSIFCIDHIYPALPSKAQVDDQSLSQLTKQ